MFLFVFVCEHYLILKMQYVQIRIVKSSKGEIFLNFLELNMKHVYTAATDSTHFLPRKKLLKTIFFN